MNEFVQMIDNKELDEILFRGINMLNVSKLKVEYKSYQKQWEALFNTPLNSESKLSKEELDATELAIRAIKNKYSKEYYKNNKDKIKAQRLKFYAENKERLQEIARKKYAEMPAKRKVKYNERYKKYNQNNKEKIAARAKERYKKKKKVAISKMETTTIKRVNYDLPRYKTFT